MFMTTLLFQGGGLGWSRTAKSRAGWVCLSGLDGPRLVVFLGHPCVFVITTPIASAAAVATVATVATDHFDFAPNLMPSS
jgi:hypothetical protein